jgi:hypothetical protein
MDKFLGILSVILFVILGVGGYVAAPVLLVWGWARWVRRPKQRTLFSILSLIGFAFSTVSAFLAVALLLYSRSLGGGLHHFDDRLFMKIFRSGELISRIGIVVGILGVWRPSALRWHAPACAIGTLMFWMFTGGD